MALDPITDLRVLRTQVDLPPEGSSAQPIITFTIQGKKADGTLVTFPVATASGDMPVEAATWPAWWDDVLNPAAAAFNWEIPADPTWEPWPA
jgi:hypothetical protein